MMTGEFYDKIKDYLITDKDGFWVGIKDDAPEDVKKEWEEMEAEEKEGIMP